MVVEHSEEVHGIVLVGVADSKVVHNQHEADVMGVMLPQARGEGAWMVTIGEQKLLELVICNFSGLW